MEADGWKIDCKGILDRSEQLCVSPIALDEPLRGAVPVTNRAAQGRIDRGHPGEPCADQMKNVVSRYRFSLQPV